MRGVGGTVGSGGGGYEGGGGVRGVEVVRNGWSTSSAGGEERRGGRRALEGRGCKVDSRKGAVKSCAGLGDGGRGFRMEGVRV